MSVPTERRWCDDLMACGLCLRSQLGVAQAMPSWHVTAVEIVQDRTASIDSNKIVYVRVGSAARRSQIAQHRCWVPMIDYGVSTSLQPTLIDFTRSTSQHAVDRLWLIDIVWR